MEKFMTKRKGPGQPKKPADERRDTLRVTAPMNAAEKADIQKAVELFSKEVGMDVAEAVWARKILLKAAREAIAAAKK